MARRIRKSNEEEEKEPEPFVIESDTSNESVLIAAALVDDQARARLLRKLRPECFLHDDHRTAWACFHEMHRKGLTFDLATVKRAGAGRVNVEYLQKLVEVRPESPDNLDFHLDAALWDYARLTAVRGPVSALLEAVRDPRSEPARVRALARQVAGAFDGQGTTQIHDRKALVADQVRDLESRVSGQAAWPYGIDGLDYFPLEDGAAGHADFQRAADAAARLGGGIRRMLPGAAPGQVSVLTAMSGSGKSTIAAHLALGLARQRRRVCYAAWEPQAGMTLELLACLSLGWRRRDLVDPQGSPEDAPVRTPAGRRQIEERMHSIGRYVSFMRNPFRRVRVVGKSSNEKNLDMVQEALTDAAADVFIADLWERCLHDSEPSAEKEALFRQQAMAEEMRLHCILLAQQRLKDLEQRPDKRPTREGIKGSGAWVEVADTILGAHLPALWKDITDDTMEVFVLKQRWGKWPLGVKFDWNPDTGQVTGGDSIRYEHPGEVSETNPIDLGVKKAAGGKGWRR